MAGKMVLGWGVLLWSFFTLVTPPAAAISLTVLFLARVGMGLGEGVAFPAIYNLFARWVPGQERARSAALNVSGVSLGTVAALLLTPTIVVVWGWPMVFYLFGGLGFVWYLFWYSRVTDTPETHPTIASTEVAYIREHVPPIPSNATIPWRHLLSKTAVWAIVINHFCSNWGFYVILTWLPTYFTQALGVDLRQVGLYAILPWLVMFVMANVAGWIADSLLQRGLSVTFVRKLMQSIGFFGPALFLFLIGGGHLSPSGGQLYVLRTWAWRFCPVRLCGEPPRYRPALRRYSAGSLKHGRNDSGYYRRHPDRLHPGCHRFVEPGLFDRLRTVCFRGGGLAALFATGEQVFE